MGTVIATKRRSNTRHFSFLHPLTNTVRSTRRLFSFILLLAP